MNESGLLDELVAPFDGEPDDWDDVLRRARRPPPRRRLVLAFAGAAAAAAAASAVAAAVAAVGSRRGFPLPPTGGTSTSWSSRTRVAC